MGTDLMAASGNQMHLQQHYTANPGTSAAQNRSYFEQLKDNHERSASAHFIIGYNGEIIQCVPLDEIAYAVQTRNEDSISIECCYKADNGQFTQETYDSISMIVDSIPIPTAPPSRIRGILPCISSYTWDASVGLGLPDVFALGAAIILPLSRIKSLAIG